MGHGEPDEVGVGGEVDGDGAVPVGQEVVVGLLAERRQRHAGVVDQDVEPTEGADHRVHQRPQLIRFGDVGDDPDRGVVAVRTADLVDDGVDAVALEIDDRDPGALVGEQLGGRPAHPAGGAGDQGPLAGDRSGQ